MSRNELVVTGLSARSPLGYDADQTCAAIRAGIQGLTEHPYFFVTTPDPEWDEDERLLGGLVPGLHPNFAGRARLLELALPTLRGLVERTGLLRRELSGTAIALALPQLDDAVRTWRLDRGLVEELCERAGLPLLATAGIEQAGHASVLKAIDAARAHVDSGAASRCIVLGVESYHQLDRLGLLDRSYRLRSDRCKDGFLPSEAAVALLLERRAETTRAPLVSLGPVAFGVEPRPIVGEHSSSGTGLATALEAAIGDRVVRWVICDLNGESYRAFEWGVVRARLAERFAPPVNLMHPADCLGDVGAASAGISIACAARAFARGYAPAREALVFAGADEGLRASVVVTGPSS